MNTTLALSASRQSARAPAQAPLYEVRRSAAARDATIFFPRAESDEGLPACGLYLIAPYAAAARAPCGSPSRQHCAAGVACAPRVRALWLPCPLGVRAPRAEKDIAAAQDPRRGPPFRYRSKSAGSDIGIPPAREIRPSSSGWPFACHCIGPK